MVQGETHHQNNVYPNRNKNIMIIEVNIMIIYIVYMYIYNEYPNKIKHNEYTVAYICTHSVQIRNNGVGSIIRIVNNVYVTS